MAVNKFPVIAIEDVLLTGSEGKAAANSRPHGKYPIQRHVTAQMHMLMTVEARGLSAVQAREFFNLGGKHLTKSLFQKRIVNHKRVLVGAEKSTNLLMISMQRRRDARASETLAEINMQTNI